MNDAAGRGLPAPVPRDRRRVVIEDVSPVIDGGRFPIKRAVGEPIDVTALVFADGADDLRVLLRHRVIAAGAAESAWNTTPMSPAGADRWHARFVPDAAGYAEYAVVAWVDTFGTWRRRLRDTVERGISVSSELLEGAELVRRAANAARSGLGGKPSPTRESASERLLDWSAELRAPSPDADRISIALSDDLAADMAAWSPPPSPVTHVPLRARIERPLAAAGAWLAWPAAADTPADGDAGEPAGPDAWMPRAAELGFDVVLLPPFPDGVPPTPEAGALAHPAIGTMSDVAALVGAARAAGLELALDVAVHGTRHHGYATDHPEWFRRSPDGRFKRAPQNGAGAERLMLDLDGESWETIWEELRRVVLFWVRAGVRVFRMDRPDETPLAFWEWLIAEVHREHPDVIVVAGSARPAVLARLAKIGFTQSEIAPGPMLTAAAFAAGLDGLHEAPLAETLRLHIAGREGPVAPNDVDLGGRRLRLALAATLGSTYRVDDVDAEALDLPGPRGWPDLARRLNAIRRANPAFRTGSRVTRHHSDNPALFCFSRVSADGRDRAIVVVNMDAVHMQHGFVHVPAGSWGLPAVYTVTDELAGGQYTWKDGPNYVRLDPAGEPAHILTVS